MQFHKIVIVSAIVIGLLSVSWFILCALLKEHISNELPARPEGYAFDYVVVGAGTAGCVMASMLAKHGKGTVLLIEAGDKFGIFSRIPLLTTFQQKGLNDWGFLSARQQYSSFGLEDQRQCLPRGKGLGGSAHLNYMLHFDGYERDFNVWASAHNLTEWQWKYVKPFLRAAKAQPLEMFEIPPNYSKLSAALNEAAAEYQHRPWNFRRSQYNIKNGLRYSVYHRFLQPAQKYINFRLMTNSIAKHIQLTTADNGKLKVESLLVSTKDVHTGKEITFRVAVQRELILSAGAYQTPQLLLASGIGNVTTLQNLQIPVQKSLPAVGQQLHDHLNLPLFVSIDVVGPTLNQNALLDPFSLLKYIHSGGGHLGNFGVLAHIDNANSDQIPFGLTFFGTGAVDESVLMSISNFKRNQFRALFPRYMNASQEGFVMISSCLQPQSRGQVTITNANVRQKPPHIDPNYLSSAADVTCTISGVRAGIDIVTKSTAFTALRPRILWPRLRECDEFGPHEQDFTHNTPSDQYLECLVRHVGLGSHHPGGTCQMGRNEGNSVVDAYFRVHGISALRVVDASVLPTPISGNPNTIIVAMAMRASTWLLKAAAATTAGD